MVFFLDLGDLNLSQAGLYCQGGWRGLKLPSELWVPELPNTGGRAQGFFFENRGGDGTWQWPRAALSNAPAITVCFPSQSLPSESLVTILWFQGDCKYLVLRYYILVVSRQDFWQHWLFCAQKWFYTDCVAGSRNTPYSERDSFKGIPNSAS